MTRTGWLLVGLAGAASLLAYQKKTQIITGVQDLITPRGIRNNNPGNIRLSETRWQGEAAQQTDGAFIQFVSPEYGIRALSKILDTYANDYQLSTVAGIISRFAPSNENDTNAYIQAVSDSIGVGPNTVISMANYKPGLIAAIVAHENGQQPYTDAQINAGIVLA